MASTRRDTLKNVSHKIQAVEGQGGLKNFIVQVSVDCPICYSTKVIRDPLVKIPACSRCLNAFCLKCIGGVFISQDLRCPLCRFGWGKEELRIDMTDEEIVEIMNR